MNIPENLKYTKSHEWISVDGDIVTVGITDHAQSELGDIVYVETPTPGRSLQTSESFGTVESVKTVSDVYAPVAGVVTEVNPALGAQADLLNSDPYGNGWIMKLKINDPAELNNLLDANAYAAEAH